MIKSFYFVFHFNLLFFFFGTLSGCKLFQWLTSKLIYMCLTFHCLLRINREHFKWSIKALPLYRSHLFMLCSCPTYYIYMHRKFYQTYTYTLFFTFNSQMYFKKRKGKRVILVSTFFFPFLLPSLHSWCSKFLSSIFCLLFKEIPLVILLEQACLAINALSFLWMSLLNIYSWNIVFSFCLRFKNSCWSMFNSPDFCFLCHLHSTTEVCVCVHMYLLFSFS